jgi:nucleotide-binding universal stress UspA family protein
MFEKILVGYDGSKQSEKAFGIALEIATRFGAGVLAVSIVRPPEPAAEGELAAVIDDAKDHFEEAFSKLRKSAAERRVALETEVEVGHPAEQLVMAAERHGADLIVMGRRGKSKFQRWMLGSISGRVLEYAHCPVLVVH